MDYNPQPVKRQISVTKKAPAKNFVSASQQLLENVSHLVVFNQLGMQVYLREFIDHHKEQVIFSQLGYDFVNLEVTYDLPNILAVAVYIVVEI